MKLLAGFLLFLVFLTPALGQFSVLSRGPLSGNCPSNSLGLDYVNNNLYTCGSPVGPTPASWKIAGSGTPLNFSPNEVVFQSPSGTYVGDAGFNYLNTDPGHSDAVAGLFLGNVGTGPQSSTGGIFFHTYNNASPEIGMLPANATCPIAQCIVLPVTLGSGAVMVVTASSPLSIDANGNITCSGGCSAGFVNPMTALGDMIYGGASGAATRLAAPTGPNGVTQSLCETPLSGAGTAEVFCIPGVIIDEQTGTTYSIPITDNVHLLTGCNVNPIAWAGFALANNYVFSFLNDCAGAITYTPNSGNVYPGGGATQLVPEYWFGFAYTDNTNTYMPVMPTFKAFANTPLNYAEGFNSTTGVFSAVAVEPPITNTLNVGIYGGSSVPGPGLTINSGSCTPHNLVCRNTSNTVGNCTSGGWPNILGVCLTSSTYAPDGVVADVLLDTSQAVNYNDYLCASLVTADAVTDFGAVPCPPAQPQVGFVTTTNGTSATEAPATIILGPVLQTVGYAFNSGNSVSLLTSTAITASSLTTTGLALPVLQPSTPTRGHCSIIWEMSSGIATATFGIGTSATPSGFWISPARIWNGTAVTYGSYTVISNTTKTNIAATVAPAGTGTGYLIDFDFLLEESASGGIVTVYGLTTAGTLTIEPGSSCGWEP